MKSLLKNAYHLPWEMNSAPHGILDILRGCNVKCQACYNSDTPKFKSLEEIKSDYKRITNFRKISAIAIIGGEPLLHPDLFKVIEFLKAENLKIELFTNGLLLTEELCSKLYSLGVDLIFLHIDFGQKRSDLPENYTIDDLNNLRTQKSRMVKNAGMEAAMSITLFKSSIENFMEIVEYFISSRYINYFLVTLYRDSQGLGTLQGSLESEITGQYNLRNTDEEVAITDIVEYLNKNNYIPYCYLGGKVNNSNPRWISFVTATAFRENHLFDKMQIKFSNFEKKYLELYKKKHDVYPFFNPQNCFINSIQIIMNGIYGKCFFKNIWFLIKNWNKVKLIKRILVQAPANMLENGKLEHCECCPDLTIHKNKIVPVCVCDNFN